MAKGEIASIEQFFFCHVVFKSHLQKRCQKASKGLPLFREFHDFQVLPLGIRIVPFKRWVNSIYILHIITISHKYWLNKSVYGNDFLIYNKIKFYHCFVLINQSNNQSNQSLICDTFLIWGTRSCWLVCLFVWLALCKSLFRCLQGNTNMAWSLCTT